MWHNYRATHDEYNFDWDPKPGSIDGTALLFGRSKQRAFCQSKPWEVADTVDYLYDNECALEPLPDPASCTPRQLAM